MNRWSQKEIFAWQKKQFPDATIDSVFKHLKKEVNVELAEALYTGNGPEEAADCLGLLFAYAGLKGFDLLDELDKKMDINVKRKWNTELNEEGFHEHIEDC